MQHSILFYTIFRSNSNAGRIYGRIQNSVTVDFNYAGNMTLSPGTPVNNKTGKDGETIGFSQIADAANFWIDKLQFNVNGGGFDNTWDFSQLTGCQPVMLADNGTYHFSFLTFHLK